MRRRLLEEAHLWLGVVTPDNHEPFLDLLSAGEQRRADQIGHPETRERFLAGRVLVRRALSQYAPIAPHDWLLDVTDLGRPEIAGPSEAPPLRFNLTHTAGLVACLVTCQIDCGVDVESLDRKIEVLGIARHSFHHEERLRLEQLDPPERERHFFALWTLKEAYLKARGSGIRLRLDSASFDVTAAGDIRAGFPRSSAQAGRWQFSLFAPTSDLRLAVALARRDERERRVVGWTLDERGRARRRSLPLLAAG